NGTPFSWVYCVDIPDTVGVPADYPGATVTYNGTIAGSVANNNAGGLTGYTNPGTLATVNGAVAVAWLLTNYAAGANTADTQIALQVAIWNQIYGVTYAG